MKTYSGVEIKGNNNISTNGVVSFGMRDFPDFDYFRYNPNKPSQKFKIIKILDNWNLRYFNKVAFYELSNNILFVYKKYVFWNGKNWFQDWEWEIYSQIIQYTWKVRKYEYYFKDTFPYNYDIDICYEVWKKIKGKLYISGKFSLLILNPLIYVNIDVCGNLSYNNI